MKFLHAVNFKRESKLHEKKEYPKLPENVQGVVPKKELLDLMPWDVVREFQAFVFDKKGQAVKIGAVNPDNPELQKYAEKKFGDTIAWFLATKNDIALVLKNHTHDFKNEIRQLIESRLETNGNMTKLVDSVIRYAFTEKASDIHVEPVRDETQIRFRVDGALHIVATLARDTHAALVARFKILANLKIDEYRRPQDGRIEPEEFPDTSLRVSTVPTLYGEKIALRVMDDSNKNLSIRHLGFSEGQEGRLLENIEKPYGMIITSGPTGSGKTTTLYALLQLLKKDGMNISTLEDPIEYALHGVNQIQVNPRADLTFASGLRSLLRQDPDIIMVGEVRDSETAVMATNAAMTGHLVFTTIHTNDAASAFTRLLEMHVGDFVVSSTVNLVIAQRLVRKVCDACATKRKLSAIVLKKLKERTDIAAVLEGAEKGFLDALQKKTFRVGAGCAACFETGYLGRIGIFEFLEPNKQIHDLILQHVPSERIKAAAEKEGFKDMIIDGVEKVAAGITTFEEVLRVTKTS